MKILGIETSCDETAVAIVNDRKEILSNLIISQIDIHKEFGGVVPEVAARSHAETLDHLIKKSLLETNLKLNDLDAIASTAGPGLIGGVIVGLTMAKTISSICKKPFLAINHLEAHALTIRLTNKISFPYLLLLISGGHCQILFVKDVGDYQKIGETIDDSLGETFDKVAQMIGLEYPGGPKIEELAKIGDENKYQFTKPLLGMKNNQCNFSFSGLKTAIRRLIEKLTGEEFNHYSSPSKLSKKEKADIAASFQKVVSEIITDRLQHSLIRINQKIDNLIIAGGVAANKYINKKVVDFGNTQQLKVLAPPIKLCTDNAAMIAWTGIEKFKLGMVDNLNFKPKAKWEIAK